jgi:catechol 2,3-dioxygenase-like lactoylglutathione lyase family enzyme
VVELAKPSLDVGLYTNRYDEMRAFYVDEVGLPYEELLKAGRGVHQHRFGLRGSVLKINSVREPLAEAPTAYSRLVITSEAVERPKELTDPDGLPILVIPPGHHGATHIGIQWKVRDRAPLAAALEALGATTDDHGRFKIGTTLIVVDVDPAAPEHVDTMFARGFRYLTVQVHDVRKEHDALTAEGGGWSEERAPMKLGDVAYISFVRAPDGSWLEVSQRASLTGPLPTD